MTANQINYARLQEDRRHNRVGEVETQRHNVADENVRGRGVAAQMAQVGLGYSQLGEATRHNRASELVNWYDATGRVVSSIGQASAAQQNAATRRDELQETQRHNKASEVLGGVRTAADTATGLARSFVPYIIGR